MWINVKNPKILANFHIGLRLQHRAQLRETPLRTYCLYGKKSTCWQNWVENLQNYPLLTEFGH